MEKSDSKEGILGYLNQGELEGIIRKSRSVKRAVSKGVPEEEAVKIVFDAEKKVENGEWIELYKHSTYGSNPEYPQSVSTVRYWGSPEAIIESPNHIPKTIKRINEIFRKQKKNEHIKSENCIKTNDRFVIKRTGELVTFDEIQKMLPQNRLRKSDLAYRIGHNMMEALLARGTIGITHELDSGAGTRENKYNKKSILFGAGEDTLNREKIKDIYKRYSGITLTEEEADLKVKCYDSGHFEIPMMKYSAREKIKELFQEYKKISLTDDEADKLLREYVPESQIEKIMNGISTNGQNGLRKMHAHWEIKKMYQAKADDEKEKTGKEKGIEGLICAFFVVATLYSLSTISPYSPTGFAVLGTEIPTRTAAFALLLIAGFVFFSISARVKSREKSATD
ncbi:MAG: hypothetical protein NTV63_01495 [Candidatus Woesearchaeota archaeon]|nr:hypothetical protein [Candidatus Woesearchaeota archaeon]